MALLQRLPDEILVDIFSRLHPRDLVKSSLVSRRVCGISQLVLFKDPCLVPSSWSPNSLHIFLRAILTPGRESLATYVRELTIEWANVVTTQSETDIIHIRAAQSRVGITDDQEISGDAEVILLLHLLPQLLSLHLLPPNRSDRFDELIKSFPLIKHIEQLPIALRSLREFRCQWDTRHAGMTIETLVVLLGLPYIRSISASMTSEIEVPCPSVDAAIAAAAASSTITRLEFSFVQLPPRSLPGILKIPRGLTHFSYYTGSQNTETFDFVAFRAMLEPLRRTLKALHLDFLGDAPPIPSAITDQPITTLGSLRQWPVLDIVKCPLLALLGRGFQTSSPTHLADVLPAGIRELQILDDRYWSFEEAVREVEMLLGQKERMVPRLEKIAVYKDYRISEMVEKLRAACRTASVELVDDYTWRI